MNLTLQASNIFLGTPKHAGVSRTSLSLLEAILRRTDHSYQIIVRPEFPIPEHWLELPHVSVRRSWTKTRLWHHFGRDIEAVLHKTDAWFSVSGYVPRTPGLIKGSFVHDVFYRTYAETYTEEDRLIHEKMSANIARFSNFIVSNSQTTADEFSRLYHVPKEKFLPIPMGIGRPLDVVPQPLDLNFLEGREFLFSVSTLEPRKNFPRLFEAFASILAAQPEFPYDLVIAGGKGWKDDPISARAKELGIENRIHFIGYIDDPQLPWLFSNARLAVTPSIDEGFGVPVLEAMTYGCPVASSDRPALREVGGDVPYYFDPLSTDSIKNGILSALAELRETRSALGLQRAIEFNWDRCAEMILGRIGSLVQAK